jgi:hypothetical protein
MQSGEKVPDVDGTPFWVEVKRRQKLNVLQWYEEAEADAAGRKPVVLFFRKDRGKWMVCMSANLFIDILTSLKGAIECVSLMKRLKSSKQTDGPSGSTTVPEPSGSIGKGS